MLFLTLSLYDMFMPPILCALWATNVNLKGHSAIVHVQCPECHLLRGFNWLMQTDRQKDRQTERLEKRCLQTTLFKAGFMKYSCCMLRSRTRTITTKTDRTMAKKMLAHSLLVINFWNFSCYAELIKMQ